MEAAARRSGVEGPRLPCAASDRGVRPRALVLLGSAPMGEHVTSAENRATDAGRGDALHGIEMPRSASAWRVRGRCSTALGVPFCALRDVTERPIVVQPGAAT